MLKRLFLALVLFASASAQASITGLYGGECMPLGGLSAVKDILFEKDRFEMVQTVFADGNCQVPAYDFSIVGRYEHDEARYEMNMVFDKLRMTVLDSEIAAAFSREALCGIKDWRDHEALDVAGHDCGGHIIPKQDSVAYDIVALTGDVLRFGKPDAEHDGSSPSKRPRSWDTTLFQAK